MEEEASLAKQQQQQQEEAREKQMTGKNGISMLANPLLKNFNRTICVYCGKNNPRSKVCFKVLDVAHRKEWLKSNSLCFTCTRGSVGHVASKCRSRGCVKCRGRHHTSICDSSSPSETAQAGSSAEALANEKGKRAMEETTIIHATLMAKVNGIDARIMLDSDAGRSYICTNLIGQIGIRPFKTERRAIEKMYGTVVKQMKLIE
eukprot:gene8415-9315_t